MPAIKPKLTIDTVMCTPYAKAKAASPASARQSDSTGGKGSPDTLQGGPNAPINLAKVINVDPASIPLPESPTSPHTPAVVTKKSRSKALIYAVSSALGAILGAGVATGKYLGEAIGKFARATFVGAPKALYGKLCGLQVMGNLGRRKPEPAPKYLGPTVVRATYDAKSWDISVTVDDRFKTQKDADLAWQNYNELGRHVASVCSRFRPWDEQTKADPSVEYPSHMGTKGW